MNDFILTLEDSDELALEMSGTESFDLTIGEASVYPTYTGPTTFTPTQETQFAFTAGKVVLQDITINPIPSNYGLVTYQGNIITIS